MPSYETQLEARFCPVLPGAADGYRSRNPCGDAQALGNRESNVRSFGARTASSMVWLVLLKLAANSHETHTNLDEDPLRLL